MLVLLAWPLFLGVDHQFGEVAVADALGGALGEEVDVVLVIFKLVLLLQRLTFALLLLAFSLDAQLFVEADPPLVGIEVLVVVLDPADCLLLSHQQLFLLHSIQLSIMGRQHRRRMTE